MRIGRFSPAPGVADEPLGASLSAHIVVEAVPTVMGLATARSTAGFFPFRTPLGSGPAHVLTALTPELSRMAGGEAIRSFVL